MMALVALFVFFGIVPVILGMNGGYALFIPFFYFYGIATTSLVLFMDKK